MRMCVLYTFTSSERIDSFHYCMFHGEGERNPALALDDSGDPLPVYLPGRLELSRNGSRVPEVFCLTRTSIIVSEVVRDALKGFPGIRFAEVGFKKLVSYPYQAGDFSYCDRPAFLKNPRREDPGTLIKRLPDVPALHKTVGSYYEVIMPVLDRILDQLTDPGKLKVTVEYLGDDHVVRIPLTPDFVKKHPLIWTGLGPCGLFVMTEEVYGTLEPHIDWDYFAKARGLLREPKRRQRKNK